MLTIKEALDNPNEHTVVAALGLDPVTGDLVFTSSKWLQLRCVDPPFRAHLMNAFSLALMEFGRRGKLDA